MVSTLISRGTLRFMVYAGALNAVIFLSFLRRLVKDAPRKVFLIVGNLRVHRAKLVSAWVQTTDKRIALLSLLPYTPDHNPDRNGIPKLKALLRARAIRTMEALWKALGTSSIASTQTNAPTFSAMPAISSHPENALISEFSL